MKHTLLFLLLFMFSCSSEPSTPYTEYQANCIILEKDKDRAAAHAQKMLPEKLLSLSLSGDDQDIEDAIEEAHESAYKLYCTDVLIEEKCSVSLGGGKQCERTGDYKIMKEVEQ